MRLGRAKARIGWAVTLNGMICSVDEGVWRCRTLGPSPAGGMAMLHILAQAKGRGTGFAVVVASLAACRSPASLLPTHHAIDLREHDPLQMIDVTILNQDQFPR